MRRTLDKLGREKFSPYPLSRIEMTPNARQLRWLQFINLHGPLSSHYLYELTKDVGTNFDNNSRYLKALFRGGYVYKPIQQRSTEYPDGHFHIYELTPKGEQYLRSKGLWIDAIRPTGKWVHQFFVSSITATIDIMCQREGYRYIPPHEYLNGQPMKVDTRFSWQGRPIEKPLVPDAVFAIDYGGGKFIAYALEADRNTEPNVSKTPNRKSDLRSLLQYQELIGKKLYKTAYKREALMMLLYVTVNPGHAENFLKLAGDTLGTPAWLAVGIEDAFAEPFYPPKLLTHLFDEPLARAGREPWTIKLST